MNKFLLSVMIAVIFVGCGHKVPKTLKDYSIINNQLEYGDFKAIVAVQPAGMRLSEFVTNVGVTKAPYDICYSTNPYIVPWVFHLGKVRMDIQVERHKDGFHISQDYAPIITFDGMSRHERMKSYYSHMGSLLKAKNKELDKLDKKYFQ